MIAYPLHFLILFVQGLAISIHICKYEYICDFWDFICFLFIYFIFLCFTDFVGLVSLLLLCISLVFIWFILVVFRKFILDIWDDHLVAEFKFEFEITNHLPGLVIKFT